MTCRPARRRSATNGVVFQMSTAATAGSAVAFDAVQAIGFEMMCARNIRSLMTPYMSSYIQRHIWVEITVGIAHGTSIAVRIRPRPLNAELTTSATIMPRMNSKMTVTTVNLIVNQMALRNSVSWWRSE